STDTKLLVVSFLFGGACAAGSSLIGPCLSAGRTLPSLRRRAGGSEDSTMRIAMLAPLAEAVPPKQYGGTERVVSALTEELVRRGHAVTLFASADSCTSAELVAC